MPKNEMLEPTSDPLPEIVKAFIAGCIECDGHINLAIMPMGHVSGKVELANMSLALLEYVQKYSGGYICQVTSSGKKGKCYRLVVAKVRMYVKLLQEILPYLISKKEEGEILLRYGLGTRYGQGGQHTISIEERYKMALRVRELHQGARP
jgi:hypothetical protein